MFGVHCVGGIVGALLTAVFCDPALGGTGVYDYVANAVAPYDMAAQFKAQLWGVLTALVWSGVVAAVAFKLIDLTIGLRVTEEARSAKASTPCRTASARTTDGVCGRRPVPGPVAFSPACGRSGARFFLR